MTPAPRARWWLLYPTLMLGVLFVLPLGATVAVSFFRRVQGALPGPAFALDAYARALSPFFLERLAVTLGLAALAAALSVLIGFPFCYVLTRKPRRRQVPYLVLLLALLSLSEVIIAFAWSLLLSRTSGLSNLLVALGWLPQAVSWSPGFGAALAGFVFVALPLTVLTFYPTLSRLSPDYVEAARTLGAPPLLAFWNVVLPLMRAAIVGTTILVFVFVLGAYVIPQVLGRPAQWTLPVHITDQAVLQSNLPLAAALAVVLLLVSGVLALLAARLGRTQEPS
ncbi:ABC transporter permease [Truepera radiovictrix]|uniref:Binding-protein-dependent transport systems inner membrane component n=1 Tax=Truepera radiovictrix (strain DSM 17093 / CIP 108686 / LMG 22925 / RQ-24) TaxID=649638 RepID=D7CX31_TRURR|nr:ABC transporter permease subunit [Truepera radiovictrix]ADI14539.1 binding-protein-dependent transport systems inner membrane component [Truepera radiovictrix DSM 17093]WMT56910.1 ABC transporter permease subunit [Truepera radiovictrix]